MRRLPLIVLPGQHDGLGGYPVRRRRRDSGVAAGFLAASGLWGLGWLAWWWLA